jgi:hypothetical protein
MTESGKTGPAKPMECYRIWSNLCSDSTSYLLTRPSGTATPKGTLGSECNATTNSWGQPFPKDINTLLTRIRLARPLRSSVCSRYRLEWPSVVY